MQYGMVPYHTVTIVVHGWCMVDIVTRSTTTKIDEAFPFRPGDGRETRSLYYLKSPTHSMSPFDMSLLRGNSV